MNPLLNDVASRAAATWTKSRSVPSSPRPPRCSGLQGFSVELQDEPIEAAKVLAELDALGSPATVASTGGRYFGFVTGGALPATLAANMLAGAWDQNAGLELGSPVNAHLEKVCRGWLVSLLGLPAQMEVGFVTGATMANFTGLAAARHAVLQRARLGRRSAGTVRRAADHRHRRQRSARQRAEGARHARPRTPARSACARR